MHVKPFGDRFDSDMIPKIIGRGVDIYFRRTFSSRALPPVIETYSETAERQLKTFVYPCCGDKENASAIALFFGGGWHHGNPWQLAAIARDLSRKGATVYVPEYRVAAWDNVSVADALSDARLFFQWMIDRHSANPIFLGGSSTGGFLAANLGLTANQKPSGLVLFNPALNLKRERIARIWPMLEQPRGFDVDDLLAFDPMHNLCDDPPPTIIFHGTRDPIIPLSWIEAYATEARLRRGCCRLMPFAGYSHGFANQSLFPKAHARAIDATMEFIIETVDAK